jgi:hypothetical protein
MLLSAYDMTPVLADIKPRVLTETAFEHDELKKATT